MGIIFKTDYAIGEGALNFMIYLRKSHMAASGRVETRIRQTIALMTLLCAQNVTETRL